MFEEFLKTHAKALEAVHDDASRIAWHRNFAVDWTRNAASLASDANKTLNLNGDHQIRDEVGYLTAESQPQALAPRRTLILLSANLGWIERAAPVERRLKGQSVDCGPFDIAAYEAFRSNYFPRWYEEVIRPIGWSLAAWWNRALNFLHRVVDMPVPKRMAAVDPALRVLGWELWPFHSRKDGLTAAALRDRQLDAFAKQSLEAALRTPSDGLVVASKAGFDRVSALANAGFLRPWPETTIVGIRIQTFAHPETGRSIWAIRRQLFASRPPNRHIANRLINCIRTGTLSEQGELVEVAVPEPTTIELIPVELTSYGGDKDLICLKPVTGREADKLQPLDEEADEEEVHQRIAGYWELGLGRGTCGHAIRLALRNGRRVCLVGFVDAKVVRVLEVAKKSGIELPPEDPVAGHTMKLRNEQPTELNWPNAAQNDRFASQYDRSDGTVVVRFHTITVEDSAWIGRRLHASAKPIYWPNPGLHTTEELLPEQLEHDTTSSYSP